MPNKATQPSLTTRLGGLFCLAALTGSVSLCAHAQDGTYTVKLLTPETAQKAASAALAQCRQSGYQVGVAVVDRSGTLIAFVRDRFAGPHTVDMATNKAWTAASFKIPTLTLGVQTQTGTSLSAIRDLPKVAAVGGGLPIEASGSLVGAIGVSGAPGGEADEACAQAGIKAIADALDF